MQGRTCAGLQPSPVVHLQEQPALLFEVSMWSIFNQTSTVVIWTVDSVQSENDPQANMNQKRSLDTIFCFFSSSSLIEIRNWDLCDSASDEDEIYAKHCVIDKLGIIYMAFRFDAV